MKSANKNMRERRLTLAAQKARAGYLFSLPFLIGFFCFTLFPIIQSIILCFQSVSASQNGMVLENVGINNFKRLLTQDPTYLKSYMVPSIKDLLINFPSILIFSFFIAVLLNQKFRGRLLARIIFFLPVVISSGVIMLVQNNQIQTVMQSAISSTAGSETGIPQITDSVMVLFQNIKIGEGLIEFVQSAVDRVYDITAASGIQILIYLAGLQNISPSLYEASSIEGCTAWESFWKITFPMISPLILVNAVYTIVDIMSGLDNVMVTAIYQTSFVRGDYGYGSAMGWIYFVVIIAILGAFVAVTSRLVYYEN